MAKKSAFTLKKIDDTYHVHHRGYPAGALLRYHCALGVAAALMTVPVMVEMSPRLSQVYLFVTALLLLYAVYGYLVCLPFAALGGRISFNPKEEGLFFSKSILGKSTEFSRQIPWDGKVEPEMEAAGFKPFKFYRVKVVTDFMTYHVATFGPGQQATAEELARTIKKGRHGKPRVDAAAELLNSSGRFDAVRDSGRIKTDI